jgi:hypothetical protein
MSIIAISSRKNFKDTICFADNYIIEEFDDYNESIATWEMKDLQQRLAGLRVCMLIHGYNSEFGPAMDSYREIIDKMVGNKLIPDLYDIVLVYLWPGSKYDIAFKLAEWRADKCGPKLSIVTNQILQTAKEISVQTHSLGARVALAAQLAGAKFKHLILSEAAVQAKDFRVPKGKYANVPGEIFSFWSEHDNVLKIDFTASEFDWALGYNSLDDHIPANLHQFNCSEFVHQHSDPKRHDEYFQLWKQALTGLPK